MVHKQRKHKKKVNEKTKERKEEIEKNIRENQGKREKLKYEREKIEDKIRGLEAEYFKLEEELERIRVKELVEGGAEWQIHVYVDGELTIHEYSDKESCLVYLSLLDSETDWSESKYHYNDVQLVHNGKEIMWQKKMAIEIEGE